MKKLILITVIAMSFSANAGTAFLTGERVTGMTKQCYYDYFGSEYILTKKSYDLCPLTIRV